MAYPSKYSKDLEQEDKLMLLYKIAMAALVSANGEEEAKKILITLGCDTNLITELEKIHKQVARALNMPQKEVDRIYKKVIINREQEISMAVTKAVNEIGR